MTRASFDRNITVYTQSSPGVPGVVTGYGPCRFVRSRRIGSYLWTGLENWVYVTSEVGVIVSPTYSVVPGTFSQSVDFSSASIIEFADSPGEFYVITGEQLFDVAPLYRRFFIAESSAFVSPLPPNVSCENASSVGFGDNHGTKPEGYHLWYYTGGYGLDMHVTFHADDPSMNCQLYTGDCNDPTVITNLTPGDCASFTAGGGSSGFLFYLWGTDPSGPFTISLGTGLCP